MGSRTGQRGDGANIRLLVEYVPGKTKPRDMTDGEINRELPTATGTRHDDLQAEVEDRKIVRASSEIHYTY